MNYIQPLREFSLKLQSKKLEGLARLLHLGIPTVSNAFIVSPSLFAEYRATGKISSIAAYELEQIFHTIRRAGHSITIRNSIYEEGNPAISYIVPNSLNIKNFDEVMKRIVLGYKKIKRSSIDPAKVEFCYLLQSYYVSEFCGILLSDYHHNVYIQAILGQHTNVLLRKDIVADEYLVAKRTYKIVSKKVPRKTVRIRKTSSGVVRVRVKKSDQYNSILTDSQIIHLAKLTRIIERTHGPQEVKWSVLPSGEVLFQETKDFADSPFKNLEGR